jgi:small subunit ribosomal protein S21
MDIAACLCYKLRTRMERGSGRLLALVARSCIRTTTATSHNPHEEACLLVQVRDNNVDQALKALKKKMQREGIFREMKLRNYYEKPSEKRVREQAEAVRRARKLARKKAQREGLLPGKAPAARPGAPGRPGARPGGPPRSGAGGPPRSGGFGGPR